MKWKNLCHPKTQGELDYNAIWKANEGVNSSFIWKSLLWGRNLVALGTRWRIGDGARVLIYNSHWLLTPKSFKVCSPKVLDVNATVSHLILPNGG